MTEATIIKVCALNEKLEELRSLKYQIENARWINARSSMQTPGFNKPIMLNAGLKEALYKETVKQIKTIELELNNL